jgi:hypothetical protein
MNSSATLESILTTSELTSSSTFVVDVEDHDKLSISIGDLRIDLVVDLLLVYWSACYLAN